MSGSWKFYLTLSSVFTTHTKYPTKHSWSLTFFIRYKCNNLHRTVLSEGNGITSNSLQLVSYNLIIPCTIPKLFESFHHLTTALTRGKTNISKTCLTKQTQTIWSECRDFQPVYFTSYDSNDEAWSNSIPMYCETCLTSLLTKYVRDPSGGFLTNSDVPRFPSWLLKHIPLARITLEKTQTQLQPVLKKGTH